MKEVKGLGKCESCKRCIYEADGGDGNPTIYCSKGHWDGYMPPEPDEPQPDNFDNCPDYIQSPSH